MKRSMTLACICICHHLYLYLPPSVFTEKIWKALGLSSACHQGPNFSPPWEPEIHSGHKIGTSHFFSSHRKLLRITNNGSTRREWFLLNWSSRRMSLGPSSLAVSSLPNGQTVRLSALQTSVHNGWQPMGG